MNFSASNTPLWNAVLQLALLCALLFLANVIRRKIPFIRKSLLPTAAIGGFLALGLRLLAQSGWMQPMLQNAWLGWIRLDPVFMDKITYHTIALGFIALALRIPRKSELADTAKARHDGLNSGILIAGSYLVQGILGLGITMALGYLFMPNLFKAAGLLLPMGYGASAGQAFNIGNNYELLGFKGGQAFGLSIATMGLLWACVGGVIYLNIRVRKKKLVAANQLEHGYASTEAVEDPGEVPLTEAVDRLTMQIAMVLLVYLATYLVSLGLTSLISSLAFMKGIAKTLVPLIWGFNFLIGTMVAALFKNVLVGLRKTKIMTRQYQNNYLLNRISGAAFDFMIIASICAINLSDLKGLWVPFLILCTAGGFVTLWYVRFMSDRLFPGYSEETFFSMYGTMTGPVSAGILLLREIDPEFRTPASNNLVIGSSMAILLGFPLLLLIGIAPQSEAMLWVSLGLMILYALALHAVAFVPLIRAKRRLRKQGGESA
jgi:ESS family glutamate:Na+ symporter